MKLKMKIKLNLPNLFNNTFFLINFLTTIKIQSRSLRQNIKQRSRSKNLFLINNYQKFCDFP